MSGLFKKRFPINYFVIFLLYSLTSLQAQMSSDLKDFIWNRDFKELIDLYADEKIILADEGDIAKRITARPYQEKEGMRIQLFAGSDSINALKLAREITNLKLDSVYVLQEKGLYKVQLGNFTERIEAEKMLNRLYLVGITNAWITTGTIHLPKGEQDKFTAVSVSDSAETYLMAYAIQVFVTRSYDKAQLLSHQLSQTLKENIRIIKQGEYWKILVGSYKSEEIARKKLNEIREAGFPDAWLSQVAE
jgi:hypothetical protein